MKDNILLTCGSVYSNTHSNSWSSVDCVPVWCDVVFKTNCVPGTYEIQAVAV